MASLPPRVVVLVGLPGSGKSTLAARLAAAGWKIISQDKLRARSRCEATMRKALQAGSDVVIDRCNFDEDQRVVWIKLARCGGKSIGQIACCSI
eukprot:jgi/Botrbrau1/23057/Bobra.0551s0001.1